MLDTTYIQRVERLAMSSVDFVFERKLIAALDGAKIFWDNSSFLVPSNQNNDASIDLCDIWDVIGFSRLADAKSICL